MSKKIVSIAIGAKRDPNSGYVFCSVVMSYSPDSKNTYYHRFTDILTRDIAGSETTSTGGCAFVLTKALSLLTETCRVRVYIAQDTHEMTGCMAIYAGAVRNPPPQHVNINIYPSLIRMINSRTAGGDITVGRDEQSVLVSEAQTLAVAFHDQWKADVEMKNTPSPSPSP